MNESRAILREGYWIIKAPPHVMVRLKRVFERINKGQHGVVSLTDTIENCRELRWFAERFPIAFEPRSHLDAQAERHIDREKQIALVLADGYKPPEFRMALPPREYQRVAADLALRSGSLLLADDVGLGKTISGLAVLAAPGSLPALVVTLTHLPRQWEGEINRFLPGLTVHILRKGSVYDIPAKREMKGRWPDIIISNYQKLTGWADHLAEKVKTVIFDEAQELRISTSLKYTAAAHIARGAKHRIGLTATPVFNYGAEIHSVIDCISPDSLGARDEFEREWCKGRRGEVVADPAALGQHLRAEGIMLRRTRKDVGRELPPIQTIPLTIEADTAALEQVSDKMAELARIILAQGGLSKGEKLRASSELDWRLRQATGIAKAVYVAEFVKLLALSEKKIVLYGWHREVYSIWLEHLAELNPVLYTGTESVSQKEASKDAFVSGDARVLIISLRAGAGLDGLQHVCKTVVIGELDWSPGVHEQCVGRVARDGQQESVAAYFPLADSGSDPVIADVLGLKSQQAMGIRDPDAPLLEQLQADEGRIRKLAQAYLAQHSNSGSSFFPSKEEPAGVG